jgi:hypothetical protein
MRASCRHLRSAVCGVAPVQSVPDTLEKALVVRQNDHLDTPFAALPDLFNSVILPKGVLAIERVVENNDPARLVTVMFELGEKKRKCERAFVAGAEGIAEACLSRGVPASPSSTGISLMRILKTGAGHATGIGMFGFGNAKTVFSYSPITCFVCSSSFTRAAAFSDSLIVLSLLAVSYT